MNNLSTEALVRHFRDNLEVMADIMERKNHDYSKGSAFRNFELVDNLWVCDAKTAFLVRILDKVSRITTLLKHEAKVKDEKISDTLIDLAVYSLLLKIYIDTWTSTAIGETTEFPESL